MASKLGRFFFSQYVVPPISTSALKPICLLNSQTLKKKATDVEEKPDCGGIDRNGAFQVLQPLKKMVTKGMKGDGEFLAPIKYRHANKIRKDKHTS